MSTQTFSVAGMTCGHCVNAVTEEVSDVAGVTAVEVVTSESQIDAAAIRVAVEAAGYTVSG